MSYSGSIQPKLPAALSPAVLSSAEGAAAAALEVAAEGPALASWHAVVSAGGGAAAAAVSAAALEDGALDGCVLDGAGLGAGSGAVHVTRAAPVPPCSTRRDASDSILSEARIS